MRWALPIVRSWTNATQKRPRHQQEHYSNNNHENGSHRHHRNEAPPVLSTLGPASAARAGSVLTLPPDAWPPLEAISRCLSALNAKLQFAV